MILIFGLLAGILTYACLTSPKSKKIALLIAILVALLFVCGYRNASDYDNPKNFSKEYELVLAKQGLNLQDMKAKQTEVTVYEEFGTFFIVLCGIVILVSIGVIEDLEKHEVRKIYKKILALVVVTVMYMLSLLLGLKLTLLPYIKSHKKDAETKRESLCLC